MNTKHFRVLICAVGALLCLAAAGVALAAPGRPESGDGAGGISSGGILTDRLASTGDAHASQAGSGTGGVRLPSGLRLPSGVHAPRASTLPLSARSGPNQTQILLSETFENPWPSTGWTVFDDDGSTDGDYRFARHTCRRHAGSYGAWAVGGGPNGGALACGAAYPDNANSWAVYGPLDFSAVSAATLRLYYWVNTECEGQNCATSSDPLRVMGSSDGASFDGPWVAGNWTTNASADANGWMAGSFDMKDYVAGPRSGSRSCSRATPR